MIESMELITVLGDKRIEALLTTENLSGSKLWEILSICGQILSNCSDFNEQI